MKRAIPALVILITVIPVMAKRRPIQIEIIDADSNATRNKHNHVTDTVTLRAVVDGQHAKLDCSEKSCETLAPGMYEAELDNGTVWVSYKMPLTQKEKTEKFVVRGSW